MTSKKFSINTNTQEQQPAAAESFLETPTIAPITPRPKKVRERKTRQTQILLKPSVHAAVKEEAEYQGLSFNELVGQILEQYLANRKD